MLVHFVLDEKVTDQIIQNFRRVDDQSFFLVFTPENSGKYKHITRKGEFIIQYPPGIDINSQLNSLNANSILMHAFHLEFAKELLKIKIPIKIAWYMWGFDVYGLPRIKPSTYAPITNAFLLENGIQSKWVRMILRNDLLRKAFHKISLKEDRYSILFKALKKVTYFVTYIEEDYEYFSKFYPNSLEYIYCPFSTIDQYVAGTAVIEDEVFSKETNIIVGNSNAAESNHLDCIDKLGAPENFSHGIVYFPLSYGNGSETYVDQVITAGKKTLERRFIPLLDFVNREQYIEILKSCSTGIFYHYRQQAMGNIIAMLYLGARIYLSAKNPAYQFFKKNEIFVFDFDVDYSKYKNSRLEPNSVLHNRQQLGHIFGESQVLSDIDHLATILSS